MMISSQQMWKRLDNIGASFHPDKSKNGIVFFPLKDELAKDLDARIARWKAGEKVAGMDRDHTRGERIGIVQYVEYDRRIDAS